MRPNRRQLAVLKEDTPGTSEAPLSAADVLVRIRSDSAFNPEAEQIDTEEVQGSSSKSPHLIGHKRFQSDVSYLVRGPGNLATAPALSALWGMSMFIRRAAKKVAIGAITGTFKDGEIFHSDGAGTPKGEVFRDHSGSPGTLAYVPTTGTVASGEVLTGQTSGATVTTSGAPADNGSIFQLTDDDFAASGHHCTVEYLLDGMAFVGRGCLADLTLEFRNNHPAICRQSILGALETHLDQALYTIAAYPESSVAAPRFRNVGLKIGAYSPTDIVEFSLAFPMGNFLREDANDASEAGVKFADYNREAPTITFEPAMVKVATFDYFTNFFDGTQFAMTWTLGSAAGSTWKFYADSCQVLTQGISSREDLATTPLEIRVSGSNNRDVLIHQL